MTAGPGQGNFLNSLRERRYVRQIATLTTCRRDNAHDRNISIFRRRASTVTGNTLIKPNDASVKQARDSLHRGTHKVTKKVAAAPCSENAGAKNLKKFTETCFLAHYYACKFGLNRLRIDGDNRQKPL